MLSEHAIWNCRKCGEAFEPKPYQRRKSDRTCRRCLTAETVAWYRKNGRSPSKQRVNRAAQTAHEARKYRDCEDFRIRRRARDGARKAIARGKLVREPCEVCGAIEVHAHHDDYSQPLNVRWLCPSCHRAHHDAQRAASACTAVR